MLVILKTRCMNGTQRVEAGTPIDLAEPEAMRLIARGIAFEPAPEPAPKKRAKKPEDE